MNKRKTFGLGVLLFTVTLAGLQHASAQSLSVYLSAPSVQSTFLDGTSGNGLATTETFNSWTPGTTTGNISSDIGTYEFSSAGKILPADDYGGANGTQYLAFGKESGAPGPVTIVLNQDSNYFGFWFSAGDKNNGISFYNGNTLLARYTVASILTLLTPTNGMVTAVGGGKYNNSSYYGNPNGGGDSSEVFSYVDIVASGISFNKIVLDNSGNSTDTGFESDNHSVYAGDVTIPNADVLVTTLDAVPEPSRYAALLGALIFCLVAGQRLLKKLNLDLVPAVAVSR